MKTLPSIGSLLDRGFELYFKNVRGFTSFSALYFVALIPFVVGTILAPGNDIEFLVANGLVSSIEKIGLVLNGFVTLSVQIIASVFIPICIILASATLLSKREIEAKPTFLKSVREFPFVLSIQITQFFITMLPLLAIAPGFFLVWLSVNNGIGLLSLLGIFLYFFGLIFAVAGILYIGIHLQFSRFAYLIDGTSLFTSLTSSRDLVRGRFLSTLVRLFIPRLIAFTGFFLSQLLAYVAITIFFFYLPLAPSDLVSKSADILSAVMMMALLTIWYPLFTVTDTVLYHDLKDSRS